MTTITTTSAECLTAAEARQARVLASLEAARIARDELRARLAKTRESYLGDSAVAALEGGEQPSRARLIELEQQLPEAEDRVAVLERAVAEAARQVRHARADMLDEQAAAVREETTRRQDRIHELEPQLAAMQREIEEHSSWIINEGPLRASQFNAEATRLRSALQ